MKISEKIESEMISEIVSMVVEHEENNQAKEYDNVVYVVLTNPVKLYNSARGVREFSVVGFYDQEDELILVGNLDCNDKPIFDNVENYRNGVMNIYAQLCGTVLCNEYKC